MVAEDFAADPYTALTSLPPGTPIARSARGLEVLTYRACQEVFQTTALTPCMPELLSALGCTDQGVLRFVAEELFSKEDAEHLRLRSAVAGFFTPGRMRRWRTTMAEIATEIVDSVPADGRCDAMRDIAQPAVARFSCRLLGAPDSDADLVYRLSADFGELLGGENVWKYPDFRDTIEDYLRDLLRQRRSEPRDDALSFILRGEHEGNHSEADSLRVALTILGAGSQMVAAQAALLINALVEHPDQWDLVRQQPDLVPAAVLECTRLRPTVFATERIARDDVEIRGVPIRRGQFLFVHILVANRDPTVFQDPLRLDVRRTFATPPLTWSVGRHFCVGRALSLLALEEILRAIRSRWVSLRSTARPTVGGLPFAVRPERMPIVVERRPARARGE
ncbi:Cytochrome P450 [Streptoalloteichus tenebrarius]|uniref:Cytochrome P450 n=1 Tax=Streptoalloteichus tenebrarius (strain ATCC 17920 / DSM 40477 / JCM 4838 / CBS 697.72 / NBRC 16177 / NCIMB 11028 / NRRL B-12390 / A12253. 1 / ISP 5477) TaxID=1933 RepID=A0ABT1HME3_STRSD|nr:Cytochrome P450 [Streptoalloteichus tenebrarius]